MDTAHYKDLLLRKEQELLDSIARLQKDAVESPSAEVQDSGDLSVSDVEKDSAFDESTRQWSTLEQVRAALERMADGTYGKCIEDGEVIPPARLEAIPWTPYCLKHQEKRDAPPETEGATL